MLSDQDRDDQAWEACPRGKFGQLATKLRQRRQRRLFLQTAASAGIIAFGGVGLWLSLRSAVDDRTIADIACSDVRGHLPAYLGGDLDEDLLARIEKHLELCAPCRSRLEKMQQHNCPGCGPGEA